MLFYYFLTLREPCKRNVPQPLKQSCPRTVPGGSYFKPFLGKQDSVQKFNQQAPKVILAVTTARGHGGRGATVNLNSKFSKLGFSDWGEGSKSTSNPSFPW